MKCVLYSTIVTAAVIIGAFPVLATNRITLVYTNSLNGKIDYCHCSESPNGGLVKRATMFKKLRQEYPSSIYFDTGDFLLFERDDLLSKYLIMGFQILAYDAMVCGDQEFSMGVTAFIEASRKLPLLCNNLLISDNGVFKTPFKRNIIIRKGLIKIGVIGTISEKSFLYFDKKITSKIQVSEQVAEIRKDLNMLKKQNPDLIVLLSHSGYERDKILAEKINDIDVIIGGHTQHLIENPTYSRRTIIVQAGMNGAHIGILDIYREKNRTVKFSNSFVVPDDKEPADDPYVRKLINKYKEESRTLSKEIRFD